MVSLAHVCPQARHVDLQPKNEPMMQRNLPSCMDSKMMTHMVLPLDKPTCRHSCHQKPSCAYSCGYSSVCRNTDYDPSPVAFGRRLCFGPGGSLWTPQAAWAPKQEVGLVHPQVNLLVIPCRSYSPKGVSKITFRAFAVLQALTSFSFRE